MNFFFKLRRYIATERDFLTVDKFKVLEKTNGDYFDLSKPKHD
jgi:hypothetical protein